MYYLVTWDEGGLDSFGCAGKSREFETYEEAKKFALEEALLELNCYGMSPTAKVVISKCEVLDTFSNEGK